MNAAIDHHSHQRLQLLLHRSTLRMMLSAAGRISDALAKFLACELFVRFPVFFARRGDDIGG
jgi:hypothetical protein